MFGQKSRVQTGAILDVLHEDTMPSAGQELPVHGESGDNVTTLHSTGRHRLEWLLMVMSPIVTARKER